MGHGPARGEIHGAAEADLETTITDLMSGQYGDPVRVVAFNTSERWSEDASEDVAREILRRLDLAGGALPSSLVPFVDSHLGPDRQLTLRLA
jgi:hypothetical protein